MSSAFLHSSDAIPRMPKILEKSTRRIKCIFSLCIFHVTLQLLRASIPFIHSIISYNAYEDHFTIVNILLAFICQIENTLESQLFGHYEAILPQSPFSRYTSATEEELAPNKLQILKIIKQRFLYTVSRLTALLCSLCRELWRVKTLVISEQRLTWGQTYWKCANRWSLRINTQIPPKYRSLPFPKYRCCKQWWCND